MASNEAERRRWNDAYWTSVWLRREELTGRVTPLLLGRLAPASGERLLEVGCGGGTATFALAEAVAPGEVVAADLSEPLVGLARRRAAARGVGNVTLLVADVQDDEISGAPFDAVVSQFGVMFFDHPSRAFTRLRSLVRPGGRLTFACWRSAELDPWSLSPLIGRFLSRRSAAPPGPPAGPAPGPFALADPGATRSLLEAAGWIDVDLRVDDLVVPVARDVVFDDGELEWRGVPEQVLAEARSAVTAELDRLAGPDGRLDAPLAVWTVTAGAG